MGGFNQIRTNATIHLQRFINETLRIEKVERPEERKEGKGARLVEAQPIRRPWPPSLRVVSPDKLDILEALKTHFLRLLSFHFNDDLIC